MSPVRVALLVLCTLLVGTGIGYGASHLRGSGRPATAGAAALAPPQPTTTGASRTAAFSACKNDETFVCYQRVFRSIVDARDPGVALDDLDALYKSDAYVKRTCHPLAHEIGHLAYAKYKSVTAAEQYARETCWSGYHHGLMESYISQFSDRQLRTKMNGICKQDPTHPYSLAYYNCWHGLGHGL
ncbi:MAG: copper transport protein, partial [Gaiellales bacterium]|nr:copper transport protein [Gaiellales bacterium]